MNVWTRLCQCMPCKLALKSLQEFAEITSLLQAAFRQGQLVQHDENLNDMAPLFSRWRMSSCGRAGFRAFSPAVLRLEWEPASPYAISGIAGHCAGSKGVSVPGLGAGLPQVQHFLGHLLT